MPINDVSDLLSDPDFAVTFSIVRRFKSESTGVVQTYTQTLPNIVGCIQAPDIETLRQEPDLAEADGAIEVWTATQLYGQTSTTLADLILYEGVQYTVAKMLGDWQQMGGYSHALASTYDRKIPGPPIPAGLQPDAVSNT